VGRKKHIEVEDEIPEATEGEEVGEEGVEDVVLETEEVVCPFCTHTDIANGLCNHGR